MEVNRGPIYEPKFMEPMDGIETTNLGPRYYSGADDYRVPPSAADDYQRAVPRMVDDYRVVPDVGAEEGITWDDKEISWDEKDFEKERRKSYTCYFKLKVVQFAEESSNSKAAEEFDVHRRRVQEWRMQKHKLIEQISSAKGDTKRLSGGGRKVKSVERRSQHESLERCLTSWLQGQLHMGFNISAELVLNEAKACYPNNSNYATMKWAKEFLKQIKTEVFSKPGGTDENRDQVKRRTMADPYKREKVLKALFAKTYSIRDWLDGTVDR